MSQSNDRHEAQRWLDTAADDLRAAQTLAAGQLYAHACFSAQQCAEKAVKAIWYLVGADPWGHSVQRLIEELPQKEQLEGAAALREKGAILDRFYIPTRYPNGLPDLTPEKSYFSTDADRAIGLAGEVLDACRRWIDA